MRNAVSLGLGLAVLLIGVVQASAQESAIEAELRAAASDAHARFVEAADAYRAARGDDDDDKRDAAFDAFMGAKSQFVDAFRKTKPEAWPPETSKNLIEIGLIGSSDAARDEENWTEAVRLLDLLVERDPDGKTADWVRTEKLPAAVFGTADPEVMFPRLEALMSQVPAHARYRIARSTARARAATGDYDGAVISYDLAASLARQHTSPDPAADSPEDIGKILTIERDRIGEVIAPIEPTTAIGGSKLAAKPRHGTVLVLDTFEITSPMTSFKRVAVAEALAPLQKDSRVRPIGVTWYPASSAGLIPAKVYLPGEKLEAVPVDGETFPNIVKRWHKAAGMKYPLLIVPEPSSAVFRVVTATISGPRLVDGAGRVAYMTPGGLDPHELRAAVRMILGRKSGSATRKR